MRRAFGVIVVALAACAVAEAQPPAGVSRPPNEGQLTDQELGAQLFAGNCSVCHGARGEGVSVPRVSAQGIKGQGPSLRGVGKRAADFYLSTGYMPLGNPHDQPWRSRVLFTRRELRALVDYVGSLGGGPPIPRPAPERGHVPRGLRLFTEHCAGCHQAVGEGGYVTNARVPALKSATPTQVAEAVRVGPYLMPKFSRTAISDQELNSIIAYIERSKKPTDRGGWGIGHIGPVPEGIIAWAVAALVLVGLCAVIGERIRT